MFTEHTTSTSTDSLSDNAAAQVMLRTANESALIIAQVQLVTMGSTTARSVVYAADAPAAAEDNTLWVDSDDLVTRIYDLVNTTWNVIADDSVGYALANCMRSYNAIQGLPLNEDRTVLVLHQTQQPSAAQVDPGDIWLDSDDHDRVYRWDSETWVDLSTVIYTSPNRESVYYQDTEPLDPRHGDIWYDTSNDNALNTYDEVLGLWTIRPFGNSAITAKAISTDKLALGVLSTNPVPDPSFEDPEPFGTLANLSWQLDASWGGTGAPAVRKKHGGRSGNYGLKVDTTGVITRTNLATNPGFERGLIDVGNHYCTAESSSVWVSNPVNNNGDLTISRKSLRLTAGTGNVAGNTWASVGYDFNSGLTMGLLPGHTYQFSADTYWPVAGTGTTYDNRHRRLMFFANQLVADTPWRYFSTQGAASGLSRVYLQMTIPPYATQTTLTLYNGYNGSANVCYWDNLLIEEILTPPDYFDGDSTIPGTVCSWTGTALTSTSRQVSSTTGRTRINLLTNPSFENGISNVTASACTVISATDWVATGLPGQHGTRSVKLSPNSTTNADSYITIDGSTMANNSYALVAGHTYTVSGTYYAPVAQTGIIAPGNHLDGDQNRNRAICVFWKETSGDANYGNLFSSRASATGATRLSVTFTLPPVLNTVGIRFYNGYSSTAANVCYWDDLILEEIDVAAQDKPYFDGDSESLTSLTSYNWIDNVGYSASTMGTGLARINSGIFPIHSMADASKVSLSYSSVDGDGKAFARVYAGVDENSLALVPINPPYVIDAIQQNSSETIGGTTQVVPTTASYTQWFADVQWATLVPRPKVAMLQIECAGPGTIWVDDVSCIPQNIGGAAELTAAGLRLFDQDGTEEVALVSNRPNTFSITHGTDTYSYINEQGDALFQNLNIIGDPIISGRTLSDYLDDFPKGVVAFTRYSAAYRATAVTELGLGTISWTPFPGRMYRITWSGMGFYTTDAVADFMYIIRYTWGATMPTISSAAIKTFEDHNTVLNASKNAEITWFWFGGDGTSQLNLLFSGRRALGSGTTQFNTSTNTAISFCVEDMGPLQNVSWNGTNGGGTGAAPPSPPVSDPKVQMVSRWVSSAYQSYKGDGGARAGGNGGYVYQGYYSSTQGNQSGAWFFQNGAVSGDAGWTPWNMANVISVDRVQIYLKNEHFYNNSGGNVRIVGHNSGNTATRPASWTVIGDIGGWGKGEGRWVDVSTANWKALFRGFGVGPGGDNSLVWYGYWNQSAQLQITYTRYK